MVKTIIFKKFPERVFLLSIGFLLLSISLILYKWGGGVEYNDIMTQEQQIQVIAIYEDAIAKLTILGSERKSIISQYIKELEEKKVEFLKQSLSNN